MKKISCIILFSVLTLTVSRSLAQCGMTIHYSYLVGSCDTSLRYVGILYITGNTNTPFSILWEDGSTGMSTQLDTGYHTVCLWDNTGCMQCDTFPVNCVDWNGNTGIWRNDTYSFNLFLSPATNELTIENGELKIESIEIYSSLGEKVFEKHPTSEIGHLSISVADFPPGIYFITVTDQAGNKVTKKVVKM